jgi:hypothetical protein
MVMGADRAVLGELETSTFRAVWRNQDYASFRAGLVDGPPPDPVTTTRTSAA